MDLTPPEPMFVYNEATYQSNVADAITKIRTVLGPTDPAKAPPGTIRKEFGSSIMVNAAHASDAPENAVREIGIVKVADNSLKGFVESARASA